jgi:hypothetical protein
MYVGLLVQEFLALMSCLGEFCTQIAVSASSFKRAGMTDKGPASAIAGKRLRFFYERMRPALIGRAARRIKVTVKAADMAFIAGSLVVICRFF